MSKIVVIGFGPFGKQSANPSEQLLLRLSKADQLLEFVILPTSYERAWDALHSTIENLNPDVYLIFGYSSRVARVRIDPIAGHRDTALTPDNDGVTRSGIIDVRLPHDLKTSIAVDQLVKHLALAGIRVDVGAKPTGYVCNHIYFKLLDYLE